MTTIQEHTELVNKREGVISREIFVNESIYQEEQEKIFRKSWLYIGHTSQVREEGDFILSRMGEESVIMARGSSGEVEVMLNSCRHRGMRVCRYDEGNTQKFYCPYHGWSYGLDGALTSVTEFEKEYRNGNFRMEDWGLIKAAKVAIVRGTVWATWDSNAPSFEDYLGNAYDMLDLSFCAWDGEGEVEVIGSTQKWIIPSNWKIVAENFAGDMLHNISHRSVDLVGIGPNAREGRRDMGMAEICQASYPEGHAAVFAFFDPTHPRGEYSASPEAAAYHECCMRKRAEVLKDRAGIMPGVGTIFPNTSFHGGQPRTILAAHPISVNKTELWRQYFVDRNAPPETKDFLRHYYMRYSGPAGLTEQDDMENWNYATNASRGIIAREHPYSYAAGIGNETTNNRLPGAISSGTTNSEANARTYYGRWAELMGR